jgi:glutamate N-acetyltransferase/amino-acid N-acetyltransferase
MPVGAPCVAVAQLAGAVQAAAEGDEVDFEIGLPGDGADTELFFSDLGHEYVTINAEYTT